MKKTFKGIGRDKQTNEIIFHSDSYFTSKTEFTKNFRLNGYAVSSQKVKEVEVFDYIMEHTDATPDHWKYINNLDDVNQHKKLGDKFITQTLDKNLKRLLTSLD